jgi:hypothetical protein
MQPEGGELWIDNQQTESFDARRALMQGTNSSLSLLGYG